MTADEQERFDQVAAEATALRFIVAGLLSSSLDKEALRQSVERHIEAGISQLLGIATPDAYISLVQRKAEEIAPARTI